MSEWLKEHAWKAKRPTITERYRNTSLHNRFNDLSPPDAPRCDSVNLCIRRRFRAHLTQFPASLVPVRRDVPRYASVRPSNPPLRCDHPRELPVGPENRCEATLAFAISNSTSMRRDWTHADWISQGQKSFTDEFRSVTTTVNNFIR